MDGTLAWRTRLESDGTRSVSLGGAVTERSDFDGLVRELSADRGEIVLDLSGIEHINSFGVSRWITFVTSLASLGSVGSGGSREAGPRSVLLDRCSPAMVRQFNIVAGSTGGGRVRSILVPYHCEECGASCVRELVIEPAKPPKLEPSIPCDACGARAEFDDIESAYLGFIRR